MNKFEILTSVPFGVVHSNEYAHRILSPYCDPGKGVAKAAQIMGIQLISWETEDPVEAYCLLTERLLTGPVVLGPVNMGKLNYLAKPGIYENVPHYITVYKHENARFYINDSEGLIGYYIPEDVIMKFWDASELYETNYSYNLKYILKKEEMPREEDMIYRALLNAKENFHQAIAKGEGPEAFKRLWATLSMSGRRYYNNLFFDMEIFIQRKYLLLETLEWAYKKSIIKRNKEVINIVSQQIHTAAEINSCIRHKQVLDQKELYELYRKEDELTIVFQEGGLI
ncbi:hypothetical protein R2R35_24160 [Anaerocolumna sp. AGMB13020]|uniref:hypothetical protein n=1 Tax=Anaerocolumna sp. AGMB13020 TaxID=3081750 RepID=UPI002954CD7D|nr:hypothetical protein [Anaerocolumna sp. AGMB13020]WOO36847.1 hypothetical protein R2R35_24160 [Anaerocolumna sp. AGMB13020]